MNMLLSVPCDQVNSIRIDSEQLLHPALQVAVSHSVDLAGYMVDSEPLGRLLSEAIDGGHLLSNEYMHPLRSPVYHDAVSVHLLSAKLDRAWGDAKSRLGQVDETAFEFRDLLSVLRFYREASAHGHCVVSVLLPPTDVDGYDWVKLPFTADSPKRSKAAANPVRRFSASAKSASSLRSLALTGAAVAILGALFMRLCRWRYRRQQRAGKAPSELPKALGDETRKSDGDITY